MRSDGDDLTGAFERAFRTRALALSESGRYLADQEGAQQQTRVAESEQEARDWVKAQGMGDAIPAPADYDYAAMLRDGVYPAKDGAGRMSLPPMYFRPGRMVIGGVDVATGRRVTSSVPLEERILSGAWDADGDGVPDVPGLLAGMSQDDLSELGPRERRSLEAWAESHGLMLAQGGTQATQTDITNGTIGPIPRNQVQEVVGRLGSWIQRLATELDKAGISIPTPLENDPRISLKDITVGDLGKVLEDISFGFWPISGGNAATGGVGTFGAKPEALEILNTAPAVGAAAKAATKGAKTIGKAIP